MLGCANLVCKLVALSDRQQHECSSWPEMEIKRTRLRTVMRIGNNEFCFRGKSPMMGFKPPLTAEQVEAIGDISQASETLRVALDPSADFDPIPAPQPGDWLAEHPESGQSFDDYVRSKPNRPEGLRTKVYLAPLGEFAETRSPSLETLKSFAATFFAMDVRVLSAYDLGQLPLTTRINPYTGNQQILTTDVLDYLLGMLPTDAFCLLAVTMEDLYPDPRWNFVFGQATLRHRVGVFSFARYDPAFYGEARTGDYHTVLLKRACKVLAHETAHMFLLEHCIFFKCLINGSNHLAESDSRPLHLCPVCLRKLQFSIGFDVVDRYRKLLSFHQRVGFDDESVWIEKRLKLIQDRSRGTTHIIT